MSISGGVEPGKLFYKVLLGIYMLLSRESGAISFKIDSHLLILLAYMKSSTNMHFGQTQTGRESAHACGYGLE